MLCKNHPLIRKGGLLYLIKYLLLSSTQIKQGRIRRFYILLSHYRACKILLSDRFSSDNIGILFRFWKIVPKDIPSADTYLKSLIFFRMRLCISQDIRIENIEMNRSASHVYIRL